MMHKWRASFFTLLLVGALGLIFLTTGLAFAAPPAGTISYWKLDETVAGVPGVADAYEDVVNAPNGNNGQVPLAKTAPAPNPAGRVGGAQDFDGVDNAIDVPDPMDDSFDFALTDSFTIECWMKSAKVFVDGDILPHVIVGRDDFFTSGMQWWLGMEQFGGTTTPGNVTFYLRDTDGKDQTLVPAVAVPINDDKWYHLVGIYDGTNDAVYLYVNGVKVAEKLTPTGFTGDFVAAAGADLNLGWLDIVGEYHYEGALDEVALYNRALTPTEIDQHYDDGLAGHGIDYVAPDDDGNGGGGGGGSSGCFIATTAK